MYIIIQLYVQCTHFIFKKLTMKTAGKSFFKCLCMYLLIYLLPLKLNHLDTKKLGLGYKAKLY